MENSDWLANDRAGRLVQAKNIAAKAPNYTTELNLTPAWISRMQLNAEVYETVFDSLAQIRATVKEMGDWAEEMYESKENEDPAPRVPSYQTITLPAGALRGLDKTLRDFAEYAKDQSGYTEAIGLDLMIYKHPVEKPAPETLVPSFDLKFSGNFALTADFKKQGQDALQFEYQSAGESTWQKFVALRSPFTFQITPKTAGTPEKGYVRAIFMDGNETVGQYSPLYPVTLS